MALWHRKRRQGRARSLTPLEPAPPFPEFPYHPDPRKTGSIVDVEPAVLRRLRAPRTGSSTPGPVFAADDYRRRAAVPLVHRRRLRGRCGCGVEFTDVGEDVPDDVPGRRARRDHANARPGFNGWQQEHWLYHCGDGAAFLGTTEAAGETAYRFRCRHCGIGLAYTDSP